MISASGPTTKPRRTAMLMDVTERKPEAKGALAGRAALVTGNAICPGYVWTPLVEAQIEDQAKSHGIPREAVIRDVLLANQPNKRLATVEEIGALTVFLAGEAAASITGTALPVDGGWTAHWGADFNLLRTGVDHYSTS